MALKFFSQRCLRSFTSIINIFDIHIPLIKRFHLCRSPLNVYIFTLICFSVCYRSRSPTPNFTSTHHTKLSTTNKSPQHIVKNSGPQSLPFIPTSPKSKHVASIQIPVEHKVRSDGNYFKLQYCKY